MCYNLKTLRSMRIQARGEGYFCLIRSLKNEKTSDDAVKSGSKTQTWFSKKNVHPGGQGRYRPPPAEGTQTIVHLKLLIREQAARLISLYQKYIRIFLPHACRFWPTCSDYSREAILKYGFIKGGIKAVYRICLCQPFSGKSGFHPLQ